MKARILNNVGGIRLSFETQKKKSFEAEISEAEIVGLETTAGHGDVYPRQFPPGFMAKYMRRHSAILRRTSVSQGSPRMYVAKQLLQLATNCVQVVSSLPSALRKIFFLHVPFLCFFILCYLPALLLPLLLDIGA